MTERPQVTAAKVQKLGRILTDEDDLKQMAKSKRPGSATMDEVRVAARDATQETLETGGSVSDVMDVDLPSERLK